MLGIPQFLLIFLSFGCSYYILIFSLKAHCRGADWRNKTIKKKRIRHGSVISLYSEIHNNDNDLIPFILEKKQDQEHESLVITQRKELFFISKSQLANHSHDGVPLSN